MKTEQWKCAECGIEQGRHDQWFEGDICDICHENSQPLTAQKLYDFLTDLKEQGQDLERIFVNYRHDYDADVENCVMVGEDLYDSESNSTLESIILMSDIREI